MIQTKFLPPVIRYIVKDFESAAAHPVEHYHQARLDADRTILELCMLVQRVQAVVPVLISQCDAGAFHCFSFAVARPRYRKASTLAQNVSMLDWRELRQLKKEATEPVFKSPPRRNQLYTSGGRADYFTSS